MQFPSSSSKTNTALLVIFLAFWTYTEITEGTQRETFQSAVLSFIETIEHDRLLRRVQILETKTDAVEAFCFDDKEAKQ